MVDENNTGTIGYDKFYDKFEKTSSYTAMIVFVHWILDIKTKSSTKIEQNK